MSDADDYKMRGHGTAKWEQPCFHKLVLVIKLFEAKGFVQEAKTLRDSVQEQWPDDLVKAETVVDDYVDALGYEAQAVAGKSMEGASWLR